MFGSEICRDGGKNAPPQQFAPNTFPFTCISEKEIFIKLSHLMKGEE